MLPWPEWGLQCTQVKQTTSSPPASYVLASRRDDKICHISREPELEETKAGAVCMLRLNVQDPVRHSIAPFPLMNTRVYILEMLP